MDHLGAREGRSCGDVLEWMTQLADSTDVDGITISGGEPFNSASPRGAAHGHSSISSLQQADVFVYSGYTLSVINAATPECWIWLMPS